MANKFRCLFKYKMNPFTLYLTISLLSAALFFLLMPALGQHGLNWIVMENNSDFESADYFLTVLFSMGKERVYEFGIDACYSPLSYAFFYFFSKISGLDHLLKGVDLLSTPYEELIAMTPGLLGMPYQLLIFLIYCLPGILLYIFAISELSINRRKKQLFTLTVLFSVPFLFGALERGNLTLFVAALLLIAFLFKDSENPVKRELALLLIAAAAGLKFYPAFMGLVYLRERRFKEAGRLIIYGALLVFVPFLFFGGVSGIMHLLDSLSRLSVENPYSYRIQFLTGVLTIFGIYGKTGTILNTLFLCILAVLIICTKSKVRMLTYLAAALAFYPPNSYRYTLLFFLLPLFAWIQEDAKNCSVNNFIVAVLFSFIFSIPVFWGILTGFELSFGHYTLTYVEFFIYLAAWGLLALQLFNELKDMLSHVRISNS